MRLLGESLINFYINGRKSRISNFENSSEERTSISIILCQSKWKKIYYTIQFFLLKKISIRELSILKIFKVSSIRFSKLMNLIKTFN